MYNGLCNKEDAGGGEAMTQLIASICENGSKVIALSDRMVSTGDMTLAFEHQRMKAIAVSPKAIVLTAGTVHEPEDRKSVV